MLQPEGGACDGTFERSRESLLNKKSVNVIKNDDKNCFWYALVVSMNKDSKEIKDNRYPKRRNKLGEELCRKCKLPWNEPVSFEWVPLVEEALNINIYIMDMTNIPLLGSAFNLWECDGLMYKTEDRQTETHW